MQFQLSIGTQKVLALLLKQFRKWNIFMMLFNMEEMKLSSSKRKKLLIKMITKKHNRN